MQLKSLYYYLDLLNNLHASCMHKMQSKQIKEYETNCIFKRMSLDWTETLTQLA